MVRLFGLSFELLHQGYKIFKFLKITNLLHQKFEDYKSLKIVLSFIALQSFLSPNCLVCSLELSFPPWKVDHKTPCQPQFYLHLQTSPTCHDSFVPSTNDNNFTLIQFKVRQFEQEQEIYKLSISSLGTIGKNEIRLFQPY